MLLVYECFYLLTKDWSHKGSLRLDLPGGNNDKITKLASIPSEELQNVFRIHCSLTGVGPE
jgi:hypothetical protein